MNVVINKSFFTYSEYKSKYICLCECDVNVKKKTYRADYTAREAKWVVPPL